MDAVGSIGVRLLAFDDVDRYVCHVAAVDAGSGVDGAGHSHPYGRTEPLDLTEALGRELTRWSTPMDQPDNPGARALYALQGFQVVGRTPDRFRVDGESLDDTSMTLSVADGNSRNAPPHVPMP